MIMAKQVFFRTSNLGGHGFHWDKATILHLTLKYYSLSVLSKKLYFLEISPINEKLRPFKCMVLKNVEFKFSRLRRHLSPIQACCAKTVSGRLMKRSDF